MAEEHWWAITWAVGQSSRGRSGSSMLQFGFQLDSLSLSHTHAHKSYPCTGVDRPLGRQKLEAPRIFRQLTHEGGSLVSPTHWLSLIPRY